MKARIFQPFQKVWTPRTPDSGYDSFGFIGAPAPIVLAPLITATINTSLTLVSGTYSAASAVTGGCGTIGSTTRLVSGTYTP